MHNELQRIVWWDFGVYCEYSMFHISLLVLVLLHLRQRKNMCTQLRLKSIATRIEQTGSRYIGEKVSPVVLYASVVIPMSSDIVERTSCGLDFCLWRDSL